MKFLIVGAAMVAGLALPAMAQDAEFGMKVRQYLLANPEVLVEALQAHDAKEKQALYDRSLEAASRLRGEMLSDPDSPRIGAESGKKQLVAFSDYRCPHCRRASEALRTVLADSPDVELVIREFPVLGDQSVLSARMALAVNALHGREAYQELHDRIYDVSGRIDGAWIRKYAEEKGWDIARLEESMTSASISAEITQTAEMAQAIGIHGTPYFIIGEMLAPGALTVDQFRAVIAGEKVAQPGL